MIWNIRRNHLPHNLTPWNGTVETYGDFRDIVEDLLIDCHPGWEQVLIQNETRTTPLTDAAIAATDMHGIDALEVSKELYSFLGDVITTTMRRKRQTLAARERNNGF